MSEIKVKLTDANEQQLRAFAESHLGFTLPPNAKLETLRAKVAAAWSKDEITTTERALAPKTPKATKSETSSGEMVKIIIHRSEDAGGDEPVPLGCNGKIMLVPRGEPCEIPASYFESLKNAVKHVYEPLKDGGMNPTPREVAMYPYQRVN